MRKQVWEELKRPFRPWNFRRGCRLVCLIVAALVVVCGLLKLGKLHGLFKEVESSDEPIYSLPYNEPVKAGVTQMLEGAKSASQYALLAVGVLWGLIIAKKGERALVFGDWPEIFTFAFANGLLFTSLSCYLKYSELMTEVLVVGATTDESSGTPTIMNFRTSRINGFYEWQTFYLLLGVGTAAVCLFSAHVLKSEEAEVQPA